MMERWIGTCVCGKRCYTTRKAARHAVRQIRGRDGHLDAYRCRRDPRYWHVGHQPVLITRGEVPRDEWGTRPGDRKADPK